MSERKPGEETALGKTVDLSFEAAVAKAEEALASEGFGVLCRIDVQATLKSKLGVEFPPYVILGACYPPAAHQALQIEPRVGLLLPCNVVVRESGSGTTRVEAVNPRAMMAMFPEADLSAVARTVEERLARVVESV
jgi:uncharacterized protein (DUF302 family)